MNKGTKKRFYHIAKKKGIAYASTVRIALYRAKTGIGGRSGCNIARNEEKSILHAMWYAVIGGNKFLR
jgi:hypothetical protein